MPAAGESGLDGIRVAPNHRRSAALAGLVAIVALVAIATTGVISAVGAGSGHGTPVLKGQVLSVGDPNQVVWTAPNGSHATALPAPAATAYEGLIVAPDGRYVATTNGTVIAVSDDTFERTGIDVRFPGPPTSWSVVGFADADRALIVQGDVPDQPSWVDAAILAGDHVLSLGSADSVAADPRAVGVFVSVPSPHRVMAPGSPPGLAMSVVDTGVQLRDAGQPAKELATPAELINDLHEPSQTPVQLTVLPDPGGDKVAVVVAPPTAGVGTPRWTGIVVLSRNGALLGKVRLNTAVGGTPAWSPRGTSLVYDIFAAGRVEVAVWTLGHPVYLRSGPTAAPGLDDRFNDYCLWAIDGSGILCLDVTNIASASFGWLIADPARGRLQEVTGPILPLAWFPISVRSRQ